MKREFALLLLMLVTTAIFAQVPTNGLVAYYPFTGNTNDMSGNGYNGTNNYSTLTTDRFNVISSAYYFNGSTGYISIPYAPFALQNYSYSVWAYPVVNPANNTLTSVLNVGGYGGDQIISFTSNYSVGVTSGWSFNASNVSGGSNSWSQMALPALNTWYHLVMTRDNNFFKVYINGVLANAEVPNGIQPYYSTNPFATIGKRSAAGWDQYFTGKIDDVAIYNRALTQLEVDSLFYGNYIGINENSSNTEIININSNVFENILLINSHFTKNYNSAKLEITNLLGQTIFSKDCLIESKQLVEKIDISNFKNGIYLIKLKSGTNYYCKKIIIAR